MKQTLFSLCARALTALGGKPASKTTPAPTRYFFIRPGGVPQGPADLTALQAMLIDGRLGADALAAAAGTDDWQPATALLPRASRPAPRSSPPTASG